MTRLSIIIPIAFLVFSTLFFNCTFQNEEEYFGDELCDSALVNRDTILVFYEDLRPIFNICAECHNITYTYRQGILMDNYESVKKSFETGKPWPAINHRTYQMPKDLPKLSACEIQRIGAWIDAGMPKTEED